MDSNSETCQENVKKFRPWAIFRDILHIFTITILSLLLPLAFLLIARFKAAHYLMSISAYTTNNPFSPLASIFLYTDGRIHYVLVSFVTLAALLHGLQGEKLTKSNRFTKPVCRTCLYKAWIFLCAFQVCVCLGIEGSIAAGVNASGFGNQDEKGFAFIRRVVFFLGLHQTMLYWSKTFVKPTVDDTIFGLSRKDRWVEKVVMGLSFGTLWWWRLRGEIESLVVVMVVVADQGGKRGPRVGVRGGDFAGWLLYYLTVIIGVVKVVKSMFWVGKVLLCRKVERGIDESGYGDEKV